MIELYRQSCSISWLHPNTLELKKSQEFERQNGYVKLKEDTTGVSREPCGSREQAELMASPIEVIGIWMAKTEEYVLAKQRRSMEEKKMHSMSDAVKYLDLCLVRVLGISSCFPLSRAISRSNYHGTWAQM